MKKVSQILGQYEIVIEGKYDIFDHQVPVREFTEYLKDMLDKASVVRLGEMLEDGD